MNKQTYLAKLESLLSSLPGDERAEIMYDYDEHFMNGLADGKTEEEIIAALGSPERIASLYVILNDMEGNKTRSDKSSTQTNEQSNQDTLKIGKPNPYYDQSSKPFDNGVRKNSAGASVIVFIALLFFNLVFLLGPYIGGWGVIIGFLATSIGLIVSGIALIIASFAQTVAFVTVPISWLSHPALTLGISAIVLSLGCLFAIGTFYMIKGYVWLTAKYIRFNQRLIRGW